MAKLKTDAIEVSDLSEFLATRDDFALEIGVYNAARILGFTATFSGTYVDPVTGKSRQYDVRAHMQKKSYRVDLALECKCLQPSYPLLVSRLTRTPDESVIDFVHAGGNVTVVSDSFYRVTEPVGKALTQVGRDSNGELVGGDSDVYDKWTQAVASAAELISNAAKSSELCTAVLPILVVANGTLWAVDYAHHGPVLGLPKQVEQTTLFIQQRSSNGFVMSHLHICTQRGVIELMKSLQSTDSWDGLFAPMGWSP